MHFEAPKPASRSVTYTSAGWAKKLSYGVMLLNAISGATFLGSPLLLHFFSTGTVEKILAMNALITLLLNSVVAQQADLAQQGRINAKGLIYTPINQPGANANAPTAVYPMSKDEQIRLVDVMPYIEGYASIDEVYSDVAGKAA